MVPAPVGSSPPWKGNDSSVTGLSVVMREAQDCNLDLDRSLGSEKKKMEAREYLRRDITPSVVREPVGLAEKADWMRKR